MSSQNQASIDHIFNYKQREFKVFSGIFLSIANFFANNIYTKIYYLRLVLHFTHRKKGKIKSSQKDFVEENFVFLRNIIIAIYLKKTKTRR